MTEENPKTIEITRAMETAGAAFLRDHFPDESTGGTTDVFMAREFFLTMLRANQKLTSLDDKSRQPTGDICR